MDYTAADVKKLRDETGATFADCKNALAQEKSWEDAVKWLEARSDHKAEKMMALVVKPSREASSPMSIITTAWVSY